MTKLAYISTKNCIYSENEQNLINVIRLFEVYGQLIQAS